MVTEAEDSAWILDAPGERERPPLRDFSNLESTESRFGHRTGRGRDAEAGHPLENEELPSDTTSEAEGSLDARDLARDWRGFSPSRVSRRGWKLFGFGQGSG